MEKGHARLLLSVHKASGTGKMCHAESTVRLYLPFLASNSKGNSFIAVMSCFTSCFEQQQGRHAIGASHNQHDKNAKQDSCLGEGIRHRQQGAAGAAKYEHVNGHSPRNATQ